MKGKITYNSHNVVAHWTQIVPNVYNSNTVHLYLEDHTDIQIIYISRLMQVEQSNPYTWEMKKLQHLNLVTWKRTLYASTSTIIISRMTPNITNNKQLCKENL